MRKRNPPTYASVIIALVIVLSGVAFGVRLQSSYSSTIAQRHMEKTAVEFVTALKEYQLDTALLYSKNISLAELEAFRMGVPFELVEPENALLREVKQPPAEPSSPMIVSSYRKILEGLVSFKNSVHPKESLYVTFRYDSARSFGNQWYVYSASYSDGVQYSMHEIGPRK